MSRGTPTTPPDASSVTTRVDAWLRQFVIAENLCPFAGRARRDGMIGIVVESGGSAAVLERLAHEAGALLACDAPLEATTLIALTDRRLLDFDAYLDLVELGDALIDSLGHRGEVQLASFHPDYRFEGAPPDDPANWSNRSPWPLLHLLREDALARAIDRHADAGAIPARNVDHLRALGLHEVRHRAQAGGRA